MTKLFLYYWKQIVATDYITQHNIDKNDAIEIYLSDDEINYSVITIHFSSYVKISKYFDNILNMRKYIKYNTKNKNSKGFLYSHGDSSDCSSLVH